MRRSQGKQPAGKGKVPARKRKVTTEGEGKPAKRKYVRKDTTEGEGKPAKRKYVRKDTTTGVAPASATEKRMRSMEEALSRFLFEHMARSDLVDVIPVAYRACKSLRNDLVGQGFCMKTFSLCRALASASVRTADEGEIASHREDDKRRTETFKRLQTTIAIQIGRSPNQDERAWWLDARSLVQRCNSPGGPGNVWSWLQAASQEPDGPLSRQAAATAKILRQRLVRWPDKPRVRFPGLCTLTGHSREVTSVAYSPDGKHIVSGSYDVTVKIWDSSAGKVVSILHCHRPIVCCCVH